MRAGSFVAVLVWSTVALALPACRGAGTTAVDEPPKSVVVEQTPPAGASAPTPGGELGLGGGDNDDDAGKTPKPPRGRGPRHEQRAAAELPQLGAPCSPAAPANGGVDPCGTKGRIAVRWDPITTMSAFQPNEVGCTMQDLDKKRTAKDPRAAFVVEPRRACAKDGRIWAMASCTMCRVAFAGWSATGVIAEMTTEQSLAFQARLSLPKAIPLTTTEAWSNALASAAN